MVIIYTVILNNFAGFNINIALITITGIILSIVGQIGDLSASSIKRYAGIKDFSDINIYDTRNLIQLSLK